MAVFDHEQWVASPIATKKRLGAFLPLADSIRKRKET